MTGFIKGLFGGKKGGAAPQASKPKSGDAFFLDADSAKTFGDIDYMREVKTVERTFPKGKRKPQTRQISSDTYRNMDGQASAPSPNFTTNPSVPSTSSWGSPKKATSFNSTPAPKAAETEKRRPGSNDSGMDMFRNMAKNIRKG